MLSYNYALLCLYQTAGILAFSSLLSTAATMPLENVGKRVSMAAAFSASRPYLRPIILENVNSYLHQSMSPFRGLPNHQAEQDIEAHPAFLSFPYSI
jgi:hypothetical protein